MSQKIHATIPWRVCLYIDTDPHIVFDSELSGHVQEIAALADLNTTPSAQITWSFQKLDK